MSAITSFNPPTLDSLLDVTSIFQRSCSPKAAVHAEDFLREQRGLVAAGARANLKHYVLLVVGIFGEQGGCLGSLFELDASAGSRSWRSPFRPWNLQVGVALMEHAAGLGDAILQLLPFAELRHHYRPCPSGALVTLRYSVASLMMAGSAICALSSS